MLDGSPPFWNRSAELPEGIAISADLSWKQREQRGGRRRITLTPMVMIYTVGKACFKLLKSLLVKMNICDMSLFEPDYFPRGSDRCCNKRSITSSNVISRKIAHCPLINGWSRTCMLMIVMSLYGHEKWKQWPWRKKKTFGTTMTTTAKFDANVANVANISEMAKNICC